MDGIIVTLLSCIADICLFYYFYLSMFELKNSYQDAWKKYGLCLTAMILLTGINLYGNSYLNLLGSVMITGLLLFLMFEGTAGIRIFYFLIAYIIGIVCELAVTVFLNSSPYLQGSKAGVELAERPGQIFIMKLLTFIIFMIFRYIGGHSEKMADRKVFLYYLSIPATSLGIMLLTYYAGIDDNMSRELKVVLGIIFALMLFGNMTVFHAFRLYSEELYKNAEQELILSRQTMDADHFKQVQEMDAHYRELIHDIRHYMRTIGELAKEHQDETIINILRELNIEFEMSEKTIYCQNPVINAILSEKSASAKRREIDFDAYVEPGTELKNIADGDMITILNNLLENALAASAQTKEKSVIVRIYSDNDGAFQVIKIQNYYTGKIMRTQNGFLSTKPEQGIHGTGLKSVEKAARKYDGYLECFTENQCFTAVVLLSAPEKTKTFRE